MSLNHHPPEQIGRQSPGYDPKKRNSGLFAFLKWFKPSSASRESIEYSSSSTSCDSLNSIQSNGTVASFSYVPPSAYGNKTVEKCIVSAPETDTYRARLRQRDKRRENDKNITLRKKYNLFFNRDTLKKRQDDESTKSLPLMMTRTNDESDDEEKMHRRTNSDSSKTKKAGAYLHVKGKRRAPQPPGSSQNTLSLRRKKRIAPPPPPVIANDSLKLDHGVLKAAKEKEEEPAAMRSSLVLEPAAGRPWYKRSAVRNSTVDLAESSKEKRKSGMSFLTNISELDREASEIIQKSKSVDEHQDMPQFMRPKEEQKEVWPPPKRRSAKDLIARFNAITNVTKATVFGANSKRDYFAKSKSTEEQPRKQENMLEIHKKRIEEIDKKVNPLMKSESASAIRAVPKESTPKPERKNWKCVKCNLENDYWRIICHVCSAIKPYFDDFSKTSTEDLQNGAASSKALLTENPLERSKTQIGFSALATYNQKKVEKAVSSDEDAVSKVEEREKLKKMLIEMKNSLPKRKSNILMKQNSRASIIVENPEDLQETKPKPEEKPVQKNESKPKPEEKPLQKNESKPEMLSPVKPEAKKPQLQNAKPTVKPAEEPPKPTETKIPSPKAEKSASIIVATTETVYENIKVKKTAEPIKNPSTSQATANFELMRPKDFENIYSDSNSQSPAKYYANLARNDELSLFFNMPKNFNEIKSKLNQADDNNTDTIEINRLLRRLETSIAKGELTEAAIYAKELAQLKINCSVVRQKSEGSKKKQGFNVEMYVEDKISHRGPFSIEVTENQTVAELKLQVEQEFEIPANVQRWILGKELATDDAATLKDHKITTEKCPVFLYLVAPESKINGLKTPKIEDAPSTSKQKTDHVPKIVDVIPKSNVVEIKAKIKEEEAISSKAEIPKAVPEDDTFLDYDSKTLKPAKEWECHLCTLLNPVSSNICAVCATVRHQNEAKKPSKKQAPQRPPAPQTYLQLVSLDNKDLVENLEAFECVVCFSDVQPGQGVTLRECLHQFCKICLANTIQYTEDAEVKCPYRDNDYSCNIAIQDREIKALVSPQVYDNYLAKSVKEAENKIGKSFHCKTPDCRGWCVFEDNVNEFRCPVCRRLNCLTCQAIHTGLNCKQYQEKMNQESEVDEDAKRTKAMVEEMVKKGEALTCPTCHVILMKKWGCDWVRCSMCKTEICWVTRGPRWGPNGKGDTSGGCQCGVNGVKCHPQCSYCH